MIVVYITAGSEEEAKKISHYLVENKLAACANYFPISSVYRWKGKVEEDKEFVVLAKTRKELFEEVKKGINEIHSYEVPCILALPLEGVNKEYLEWVEKETQ